MQWLRDEEPIFAGPPDHMDTLSGELSSIKLAGIDSNGRLVIESKKAMKGRLKDNELEAGSPDLADGLGLTFAPVRQALQWDIL